MKDIREALQQSLGDAYQIERELPRGGMSRVFAARETALGRVVVLKVLAPELAATLSAERFKREITLAARLQHPHIVPLLSTGAATESLFYYHAVGRRRVVARAYGARTTDPHRRD
ncbi:MAG: hypothetical protein O2973_03095 [Gemmatimonadetes bacterium]|nr:hypothetical protein [Gemmatimonadota bacterium]